jgi:site-specific DNA recombinase
MRLSEQSSTESDVPPPRVAVGYVRVSTGRQATDGLSLAEQEKRVRAYAESRGWTMGTVYVEAGVSGRERDRPELTRLLAELHAIDVVIVPRLDRLGRSTGHLHQIYEQLEAQGVDLASVAENLDTSTAHGRLLRSVLSSVAEMESDTVSERVKAVTEVRARAGKYHGGPPPYGFRSSLLDRDPVEAPIVNRIYREYVGGRSMTSIARALIREGVPARRGHWHAGTVARILANPAYSGRIRLNGRVYPGAHDALVSQEDWERAARIRRALATTRGGGRGRSPNGSHLFVKGLLRCGSCRAALVPRTERNRQSPPTEVYYCLGRKTLGPEACDQGPITRQVVDEAALRYFEVVGLDLEATQAAFQQGMDHKLLEIEALRNVAERDHAKAIARFERVLGLFQDGEVEAADWREQRASLLSQRHAAEAQADGLRRREEELRAEIEAISACDALMERMAEIRRTVAGELASSEDVASLRAAVLSLFERFDLYRVPALADMHEWDPDSPGPVVGQRAGGDHVLIPTIRSDAFEPAADDDDWQGLPRLNRVSLRLAEPANNHSDAFVT